MAQLIQSPLITRAMQYVKEYINNNFDNNKIDDERYIEEWIEDNFKSQTTKVSFKFESCEEMAQAITYINTHNEFVGTRGVITVDYILRYFLSSIIQHNYFEFF